MSNLWKHQEIAVERALKSLPGGFGIFFEQRAGKSRTALEIARRLEASRILVLCPSQGGAVPKVWLREIAAHWPSGPRAIALAGDSRQRAEQMRTLKGPAIVIVNHESMWRPPLSGALREAGWDVVIADELHRLKSPRGAASRYAAQIGRLAPVRLGLTGTPIPHSPLDVWGEYQFLNPSLFPSTFTQFRMRYSRPAMRSEWRDPDTYAHPGRAGVLERWKFQNLDELQGRMYSCAVRVLTRDVFPDMPHEMVDDRRVELEPSARRIYRDLARTLTAEIRSGVVTAANAGVKVLRLAQLTGGTLSGESLETGERTLEQVSEAKERLLGEMLQDLTGEPVVVYGRFHTDLDAIHRACAVAGSSSSELSGRRSELDAWQNGGTQVLVGQVQAAGMGIDLTRAAIVIYYSTGYSLNDYEQSRARVLGPMQTRPVMLYHLLVENTIDEAIFAALRARKDVVASVVEQLARL